MYSQETTYTEDGFNHAVKRSTIILNDDQQAGFDSIVAFVKSDRRTLALKGYAGTGKTTLIQEVASYFYGDKSFTFTAPTNKATKVLSSMSAEQNSGVQGISTIYSLLGLRMQPDGAIKVISRKAGYDDEIPYDVVVIDECSMIGPDLYEHIEEVLERNPYLKIIFMGDPMQLPPIGEDSSIVFSTAQVKVELNKVVRQAADNPIIQLCTSVRESIQEGKTLYQLETARGADGTTGVHVLPRKVFYDWMRKAYSSEAYSENPLSFKSVAWRNITVDKMNNLIRKAIYVPDKSTGMIPRFVLGERIVIASPVTDMLGEEILATTDSEGIIISCKVDFHPWVKAHGEFKVYSLVVDFYGIGEVECYTLHEDSERTYKKKLNQMADEARKSSNLWGSFHSFKDAFHDVRYAHAITSHRSQGSTYENVFVNHADIMANRNKVESFKSFYVAASRASKNLMILS